MLFTISSIIVIVKITLYTHHSKPLTLRERFRVSVNDVNLFKPFIIICVNILYGL